MALCVIGIGLFPTLLLFLTSYRISDQSRAQAAAYVVAQRQLESIKTQQWADRIQSGVTYPAAFTVPASINTEVFGTSGRQMQGEYTVTAVSSTLQQVCIRVYWPSLVASGRTSEVCLDTLIAKSAAS